MNTYPENSPREPSRRSAVIAAAALLSTLCSGPASAQDYPSKQLRLVVGYPPGGGNDVIARSFALKLQGFLGQTVVVENRPGADTIIASDQVAKSPADGHTLLMNAMGGFTVTPILHSKLPYDPLKSFIAVGTIARFPHILAVNASVPATTIEELAAYAKANPGKLNYGSNSTAINLATELFAQTLGISIAHIPYKGSAQTAQALLTNEIQLVLSDAPPLLPHVNGGKIRLIAVTSTKRLASMPSLPTFNETAALRGFDVTPWVGLFVAAGTRPEIVRSLNAQIVRFVGLQETRERLLALGAEPIGDSPEQAAARIQQDILRFAEIAKKVGVTPIATDGK